jgi:hypothetical protein
VQSKLPFSLLKRKILFEEFQKMLSYESALAQGNPETADLEAKFKFYSKGSCPH